MCLSSGFGKGVAEGAGEADNLGVELRSYCGRVFELPAATMRGTYAAETRWRIVSEGIVECIALCPPEKRALVTNLQMAWMQAESVRDELKGAVPAGLFV